MIAGILLILAAALSLILVILSIHLLDAYSKSFFSQSLQTNPNSSSPSAVSIPLFLGSRIHHFHNHAINTPTPNSNLPIKGLESSILSSIPLFTYKSDDKSVLECVVCLSAFEDGELGRKLPNCGHGFHLECIDMWLHSHSTCPICREEVICNGKVEEIELSAAVHNGDSVMEIRVEIPNSENEIVALTDLLLDSSSSSSSSSSLALSIKRMGSKNIVDVKVQPSTNVTELDA